MGGRWIGKYPWQPEDHHDDRVIRIKVVVEAHVSTGRMCGAIKGTRTEPWGHHDLRVHKATLKGDEKELARKIEGKPGKSEVTEPKKEQVSKRIMFNQMSAKEKSSRLRLKIPKATGVSVRVEA